MIAATGGAATSSTHSPSGSRENHTGPAEGIPRAPSSLWRVCRGLLSTPSGIAGTVIVLVLVVSAVFAPGWPRSDRWRWTFQLALSPYHTGSAQTNSEGTFFVGYVWRARFARCWGFGSSHRGHNRYCRGVARRVLWSRVDQVAMRSWTPFLPSPPSCWRSGSSERLGRVKPTSNRCSGNKHPGFRAALLAPVSSRFVIWTTSSWGTSWVRAPLRPKKTRTP